MSYFTTHNLSLTLLVKEFLRLVNIWRSYGQNQWLCHNSLLHLLLKNGNFLNTDISQGSVASCLRCGGVFVYDFVRNFLLSLIMKEFWKSVNIWWLWTRVKCIVFWLTVYLLWPSQWCSHLKTARASVSPRSERCWKYDLPDRNGSEAGAFWPRPCWPVSSTSSIGILISVDHTLTR